MLLCLGSGRGLPTLYDTEIGMRAMFAAGPKPGASRTFGLGALSSNGSSVTGSMSSGSTASYPSGSASQVGGSQANNEQMEKVMEMITSLGMRVGELSGKLSAQNEGDNRTCPYCQQTGHRVSQCPKKATDKEARAKAKAAETP